MISLTGNSDQVKVGAAILPETISEGAGSARDVEGSARRARISAPPIPPPYCASDCGRGYPEQIRTCVAGLSHYVARLVGMSSLMDGLQER